jgi:2',3'-cyclic-nucleotide 2'-phosphodiesterase
MIRVLFLGEVIGLPTSKQIYTSLKKVLKEEKIDFTIANGDGASDGYGILKNTAYQLHNAGINVVTSGDYVFNKKDVKELMKAPFFIRPYNLPGSLGGKGYILSDTKESHRIAVINILGRTNFNKIFASDPFYSVSKAIEKIQESVRTIIVDFHGGATSEIQAMHWYLAGRVSLVVGSHLRVLTSDNRIINDRTAVVTGVGFCGGKQSINGLLPEIEINKLRFGQFYYSKVVTETICLQGVIAEVDENTGDALSIELFNRKIS